MKNLYGKISEFYAMYENANNGFGDERSGQRMTKEKIKKRFYILKDKVKKAKTEMCALLDEVKEREKCASIKDQIVGECASKYFDKLRIY